MESVKIIASIFAICSGYILLRLILGDVKGSGDYVQKFFAEYGDEVVLVIMVFLTVLVMADAYGWDFNPPTHKHLDKVVVVEAMSGRRAHHHHKHHHHKHHHHSHSRRNAPRNKRSILEKGFCEHHRGRAHELEDACGELSHSNCMKTDCCVYLNGDKCVAGDKNGPTFRTKKGIKLDIDHYEFRNKRYE